MWQVMTRLTYIDNQSRVLNSGGLTVVNNPITVIQAKYLGRQECLPNGVASPYS